MRAKVLDVRELLWRLDADHLALLDLVVTSLKISTLRRHLAGRLLPKSLIFPHQVLRALLEAVGGDQLLER